MIFAILAPPIYFPRISEIKAPSLFGSKHFFRRNKMAKKLSSFDYEVFGLVQGVFFRKFTQKEANKLELVGWVKNTRNDTVVGQCQGEDSKMELMKRWLCKVGSPSSRIDKCDISNEKEISQLEYSKFEIRH